MLKQQLARIHDDFKAQLGEIIDDVEASALKAKALQLWTKHQRQQREDVPLSDRFMWTYLDVANAFVHAYGGRISEPREEYPWTLLWCRNGHFVAYVKQYRLEAKP